MIPFKKILFSNPILVLFDQALYSGLNFLLTFFLARQLGLKSFGIFSVIVLISYLIMSITYALVIQPFQVSYLKVKKLNEYFTFLLIYLLIIISFFLVIAFSGYFLNLLPQDYEQYFIPGIVYISGLLLHDYFRKLYLGLQKVIITIALDGFYAVLVLASFFLFKDTLQLSSVLWILGVSFYIASVIGFYYFISDFERPLTWRLFLNDHIDQGKWLFYVAILQWCSSNFFVMVSGLYIGVEALAALRLVQTVFGVINIALVSIENYLMPKLVYFNNQSTEIFRKYILKISAIGVSLFSLLLVVIFIFSTQIITLTGGEKYSQYGYVVQLISVLYLFIFISNPIRMIIKVLILNKIFFFGFVISFVFSLLSFHFFIKYLGLTGSVLGLICNQLVMIVYWLYQLNKNNFRLWR